MAESPAGRRSRDWGTPPLTSVPAQPPASAHTQTRAALIWSAKWWILLVALIAAGTTYAVSRYVVAPTYSSSATVTVTAHTLSGGLSDTITASNDLASQYAQLATASAVLERAGRQLSAGSRGLGSAVSAGTIANQNLIQIRASASSPELARARANAVASSFVAVQTAANAVGADRLIRLLQRRLRATDRAIADARQQVQSALQTSATSPRSNAAAANSVLAAKESLLTALLTQQQAITTDAAEAAVQAQPTLGISTPAALGSQTQPKPVLYALLALLVGALVAAQGAVVLSAARGQ